MDIIKIGNSKEIRIPHAVLKQCGIDSKVELAVEDNCIIIKPVSTPRQGWAEALELMHKNNDDVLLISEEIDNEMLEVWDTENELVLVLNHEELKQNLSKFLARQIQFFNQSQFNREQAERTLDTINKCATAAEILEFANTKNLLNLQRLDLADSLKIGVWNNYLEIHITLLTFESVGKTFMEEYKGFLIYIVNLIRSTSEGNPLAGAVYATIC